MPLHRIFRQDKKARQELVRDIRRRLEFVLKRGDEDGLEFICEDDIYDIWTLEQIQILSKGLNWENPELQLRVRDEFRKILSILVWIHYEDWDDFKRIFLDHTDANGLPDRTDRSLPLGSDFQFLQNHEHRREFLSRQYIFIPVILEEESQYSNNSAEYGPLYRMPFLNSKEIGVGATGIVTKELVAAKHFRYKHGHLSTEKLWVARKRIKRDTSGPNSRNFLAEQGALRAFKQCLGHNESIMHSHTSFTHGPDFVIISPVADLNLHEFFAGKYEAFQVHQQRFTPRDLLKEASFLAGALHFLHYGLRLRERRIACAHLDFKPENILVKWNRDTNRMPVGQWFVHDFGTARIKEPHEETNALAPGDFLAHFSLTKAQRNPGPFQAPEVQPSKDRVVGRESDMWSFGCLLAVVISFALGGPRQVSALARSRYNSNPSDDGYTDDYFYTMENGRAVVKPSVVRCLQNLRTESPEDKWIGRTLDLVFNILVDRPGNRMKALACQDELDVICSEETYLQRKCAWIEPEAPIAVTGLRISGTSGGDQSVSYVDPPPLPQSPRSIPPRSHFPNREPSFNLSAFDQNQHSLFRAQYSSQAQAGPSRNPSIVLRTDTFSSHVISPPATPYHSSTERTSRSDESSSMGHGSSLGSDMTFTYIAVPPKITKSVACGHSARVGYISKTAVHVHNFSIQNTWVSRRPPKSPDRATNVYLGPQCPPGFEWDLMGLCGSHLVLRARNLLNKADCRFSRYLCHSRFVNGRNLEIWNESPFTVTMSALSASDSINGIARHVLDVSVNGQGDTLFALDAGLCYYSSSLGLHTLPTEGQLFRACFSSDGQYIFAWTLGRANQQENRWYIWNASTSLRIMNTATSRLPAERVGSGKPGLIFPLSRYFVAFEIPNRIYVVGKDPTQSQVIQLLSPIENIVAGASYEGVESQAEGVVLVQHSASPHLINLQLVPDVQNSTPASSQKLREGFNVNTHGVAIVVDSMGTFVVVTHPSGLIERRTVSS
ncbi:hypothetical protein BKA65DRAFT_243423 [Rhexocercosporidium sp. MPI-PUGE-AT-0058]|nr:hypothetical protein BKA65DRAFT_243423 [Rhexocercosporidium sp. MPI-PUGE-AT-0058]